MQTLTEIRALLDDRGLRPRKRFGQCFLHDKNQLAKLVDTAAIAPGDVVLEVGPGTGTLTETLVERGASVVACEIDDDLAGIVADRLGDRIDLVRGDCLDRGRVLAPAIVERLAGRPFTLVANLPYQVATPLMIALLLDHPACRGQFVTIQKEVADRLLAPSGVKAYGPLTVIARVLGTVELIGVVPARCFWPAPKVTSAMLAIRPRRQEGLADPKEFARFVTRLFGARRKQLGAILGRDHPWPAGLTPDRRPDALSPDELVALHAASGA